jgi:hypothetical protein
MSTSSQPPPDPFAALEQLRQWLRHHYPSGQPDAAVLLYREPPGVVREVRLPFPPAPADTPGACTHSTDFRACTVHGEEYAFSPGQAATVRVLWEAHDAGSPELGQETVLDRAGLESSQLRDVFKGRGGAMHPAWGALIIQGRSKGAFRLDLG